MDALGTIKPVVSAPMPVKSAPVLPDPAQAAPMPKIGGGEGGESFDAKQVEARRIDVLVNAARSAPQPLGSQVFTMFKDVTGQMVTRYRDQNSGRVTYIPEPNLLRLAAAKNGSESLVNIKV